MPSIKSKHFILTLNNYTPIQLARTRTFLGQKLNRKTRITYNKGCCERVNTPHVHNYIQLNCAVTATDIQNFLDVPGWDVRVCMGSSQDNVNYIDKERSKDPDVPNGLWEQGEITEMEARDKGPGQGARMDLEAVKAAIDAGATWTDLIQNHFTEASRCGQFFKECINIRDEQAMMAKLTAQYQSVTLRPWQLALDQKLNEPPDRRLFWMYETTGNVGKTWMSSYLRITRNAVVLQIAKKADLAHIISKSSSGVYIFDLARSSEEGSVSVVYELIEQLKNGYIISGKYDSRAFSFAQPHVIVFANYAPDRSKLSADRWDVTNISPLGQGPQAE